MQVVEWWWWTSLWTRRGDSIPDRPITAIHTFLRFSIIGRDACWRIGLEQSETIAVAAVIGLAVRGSSLIEQSRLLRCSAYWTVRRREICPWSLERGDFEYGAPSERKVRERSDVTTGEISTYSILSVLFCCSLDPRRRSSRNELTSLTVGKLHGKVSTTRSRSTSKVCKYLVRGWGSFSWSSGASITGEKVPQLFQA